MTRLSWSARLGAQSSRSSLVKHPVRRGLWSVMAVLAAACGGDSDDVSTSRNPDDGSRDVSAEGTDGADGGLGSSADGSPSAAGSDDPSGGGPGSSGGPDGKGGTDDPNDPDSPVVSEDDQILVDESILGDGGAFECERVVSLETVPLSAPPPFDVIIVADHSDSLSWSKPELINGLSSLLDNVVGHEVRFFVLTPTQYGESSAPAVNRYSGEELVTWRDPVTSQPYQNAMTRYVERCTAPTGERIACPAIGDLETTYEYEGQWQFVMPDPIAVVTADMTDAQVVEQQELISEYILALGGGASQVEQPMCTLNRYMLQPKEALPEHAVFLVISDEDDVSEPRDCVGEYNYYTMAVTGTWHEEGCDSDCDLWRFSASLSEASRFMSYQCVPVDDFGETFPDQASWHGQVLGAVEACTDTRAACTSAQQARASEECGPGNIVENCNTDCYDDARDRLCGFDTSDPNLDACTQPFDYEGESYANMIDFCARRYGAEGWVNCESVGMRTVPVSSHSGGGHVSSLVNAGDVLDMIRAFQLEADRHFGEDGYNVAAITHDESFDCELATGQSYAKTLRMVTDGPSHVFPICGSYAPAISEFDAFAHGLLQTEYLVTLGSNESIDTVALVDRKGTKRVLEASQYTYDEDTSMLKLDASVLSASKETLEVTLVDPCVPRAR